ncbi:UDP-2,4-diacetamido-2,4,6-trideoxy-beta-L-altropyranose hydrolase [Shewanella maritima]|uniref:UDP-2,4-diacetamido-2,4, 6-trideoxy-beta-L-altropyranose hydrolase n=1 Tax=Shewanella maritima TaxID=2520507 RepID=UPI0037350E76
MQVVIRVDASTTMGTGHVYRMLTLATRLQQSGHQVLFVSRKLNGNLFDIIKAQFELITLPSPKQHCQNAHNQHGDWLEVDYETEISEITSVLRQYLNNLKINKFDWVVADHYAIDHTWHRAVKALTHAIMQVDDLADRKHECDLLLDQNFYSDSSVRYQQHVPAQCITLLGPEYALLRDDFLPYRQQLKPYSERINQKRVVLFFGGMDRDNETEKALLGLLGVHSDHIFDVIIGQHNPHKDRLQALCDAEKSRVILHIQTKKVAAIFAEAFLYVGAVGATTWERCVLGLPAIVCSLALNQRQLSQDLHLINAHMYLGEHTKLSSAHYQDAFQRMISDKMALTLQSKLCMKLISGKGCQKVVSTMEEIRANG